MKSRIHYQTFIISASVGKNCYRHLKISGRETLEELSDSILWAFGFQNDHLHAFFMNNKAWDDTACYSSPYAEDGCPTTDKHTIQSVGLKVGQKFLYIFDFGDEWRFECKVVDILNEDTKEIELVRIRGKAPEQYPEHEEFDKSENLNIMDELEELPVPVPDSLYDTAFRFKAEKLWKKLSDTQIFAVQLSSGETGYCSVLGALREHFALNLYIGDKGFQSYYQLATAEATFERAVSQDCLQCSFENKDDIPELEVLSVQAYTKARNIHLRGSNNFPSILSAKPYQVPWFIEDEKEYTLMEEALKAGIEVAEKLKSGKPKEFGFSKNAEEIPLLIPEKDGFTWKTCHIPEITPEVFTVPELDADLLEQVKALKKVNKMECNVVCVHEPMQDEPKQAPYFPTVLLAMETRNEKILHLNTVKQYAGNEAVILKDFAENLIEAKRVPKSVAVIDDRTEALLSHFCQACDIKLTRVEHFKKLHVAEEELNSEEFLNTAMDFMGLLDFIDKIPEEQLATFPPEIQKEFITLMKSHMLPEELEEKLKKVWKL